VCFVVLEWNPFGPPRTQRCTKENTYGFNSARSVIYLTKVAGKPTAIFLLPPSCQDVQIFTSIQS